MFTKNSKLSPDSPMIITTKEVVFCTHCGGAKPLVHYTSVPEASNCKDCGMFVLNSKSMAIKEQASAFPVPQPMDDILAKMVTKQRITRPYNPTAPYIKLRRAIIDWMCELGEFLNF